MMTSIPLASDQSGRPALWSALGATFHLQHLRPEHESQLERVVEQLWTWLGGRLCWSYLSFGGFELTRRSHLEFIAGHAGNLDLSEKLLSLPEPERRLGRSLVRAARDNLEVRCTGSDDLFAASPYSCSFLATISANDDPASSMLTCDSSLSLTVDDTWPTEDFRERICSLASCMPLQWGAAGYTYAWWNYRDRSTASEAIYPHARRYHGYDIRKPTGQLEYFHDRIRSVSWLTFVGPSLAGRLTADARLPSTVQSYRAGEHLVLQAGREPLRGDVNRFEVFSDYEAVDALVRPIRARRGNEVTIVGTQWDQHSIETWLNRFEQQ